MVTVLNTGKCGWITVQSLAKIQIYWASGNDLHTISRGFRKITPFNPTHYKTIREEINSAIINRSNTINEFVVIGEPVAFYINTNQFQQWRGKYTMEYIRKLNPKS